MLFGFTGAHRSGKTTTAKRIAEELGIDFYATSTTEVGRKHGIDPVAPMNLRARLEFQKLVLGNHLTEIEKRSRPLVVDRTPLDFLGYLACEFYMVSARDTQPDVLNDAAAFFSLCLDMTKSYYDTIFHLPPLSTYQVADGKPDENRAYQQHFDLVVYGAMHRVPVANIVTLITEDFDDRCEFIHQTIVERMDAIDKQRRSAAHVN